MAYGHDMQLHVDASEDVSPREDDKPPEKHKTLLETPNPPTSQKSASKSSGYRRPRGRKKKRKSNFDLGK